MELLKKLTSKNPADFESAAKYLVDTPDIDLFRELVARDDYIFDFIKKNVAKRIFNAFNENNFQNAYKFLPFYSPYYEDVIVSVLSRYDLENATKILSEKLSAGGEDEKCYAAKFFVQNPQREIAPVLRSYVFFDNEYLALNSIEALKALEDAETYSMGLQKLDSNDDYEIYSGVKLLSRWNDKSLLDRLYKVMQNSSIPEYIALEINNLEPLEEGIENDNKEYASLALCNIISGLSELIPLDTISELNMAEIFEKISGSNDSCYSVPLMMAKRFFTDIADNDEYLFDLDKNTREYISQVHAVLSKIPNTRLESGILEEAFEDSLFVNFVIDLIDDEQTLAVFLDGNNQTLILKTLERLKSLGLFNEEYRQKGLAKITNENIKAVALAL